MSGVSGKSIVPQKVLGRTTPCNIGIRGRTCGYAVAGYATDIIKCTGKRDEGIKRGGGGVSKVISEIKHGDGVNARTQAGGHGAGLIRGHPGIRVRTNTAGSLHGGRSKRRTGDGSTAHRNARLIDVDRHFDGVGATSASVI